MITDRYSNAMIEGTLSRSNLGRHSIPGRPITNGCRASSSSSSSYAKFCAGKQEAEGRSVGDWDCLKIIFPDILPFSLIPSFLSANGAKSRHRSSSFHVPGCRTLSASELNRLQTVVYMQVCLK